MPKAGHKKKPFIDKKNAVSFHLIHRSQQDPLAADEDAPQMLLQPVDEKKKKEQREFGVFFDDDYNYMQHLKDRKLVEHDWSEADRFILEKREGSNEYKQKPSESSSTDPATTRVGNVTLPSTVFASKEEEEVGLLNKAAPRGLDLSLDPDIVAAMDDDFDFEDPDNMLDDDFIMKAMDDVLDGGEIGSDEDGEDGDWETESGEDSSECMGGRSEDEDFDEVPELQPFDDEETKTKFTNYSMSSSIIRRNKELSLLDDKFEKFMDQYGELDEGALDGEDIRGTLIEEGERMKQLLEETDEERRTRRQNVQKEKEALRRLVTLQEENECDQFEPIQVETVDPESRWDAESILSTYSNKYNHPKLISERRTIDKIELSSKTGIPKNTLGRGLTAAALRQLDMENNDGIEDDRQSITSRVSQMSIRNKHETIEEKRLRKQTVKEYRRERRLEKKANTQAFKDEKQRQDKIYINNRQNIQGNKIL